MNELNNCNVAAAIHSSLTQWPGPNQFLKRIHADFRSSFLNNYNLLIIKDFCCMPLAYFAKIRHKNFTISALRLTFSCEGMWSALVTARGTHYGTEVVNEWLRNTGLCNGFIYVFWHRNDQLAHDYCSTVALNVLDSHVNSKSLAQLFKYASPKEMIIDLTNELLYNKRIWNGSISAIKKTYVPTIAITIKFLYDGWHRKLKLTKSNEKMKSRNSLVYFVFFIPTRNKSHQTDIKQGMCSNPQ